MRRGNHQCIDLAGSDQCLTAVERHQPLDLVLGQVIGDGIRHGWQDAAFHFALEQIVYVNLPDVTQADDAYAYVVHLIVDCPALAVERAADCAIASQRRKQENVCPAKRRAKRAIPG